MGKKGPSTPADMDAYVTEQLSLYNGRETFALFQGSEPFHALRRLCLLEPRITMIRLMFNSFRGDEGYEITEEFQLEGIPHHIHGALAGIFSPEEILDAKDAPKWEVHNTRRTHMHTT